MDKRKYLTKILIAEYEYISGDDDVKFSEAVYRLKNGGIVMEYKGGRFSIYGLTIAFNKHIARKGISNVSKRDYELWKDIRARDKKGFFIDWEKTRSEQIERDHESVLKCISSNDLPF